jgi:hypothetical protein
MVICPRPEGRPFRRGRSRGYTDRPLLVVPMPGKPGTPRSRGDPGRGGDVVGRSGRPAVSARCAGIQSIRVIVQFIYRYSLLCLSRYLKRTFLLEMTSRVCYKYIRRKTSRAGVPLADMVQRDRTDRHRPPGRLTLEGGVLFFLRHTGHAGGVISSVGRSLLSGGGY